MSLQQTVRVVFAVLLLVGCTALLWGALNAKQCPVRATEGFAGANKTPEIQTELNNILLKTMGTLKRMSSYLANPAVWQERISMYKMTPGELARLQLTGQK